MHFIISVFSENPGNPLENSEVFLVPRRRGGAPSGEILRTNSNGEVSFDIPERSVEAYNLVVSATNHMPLRLEHFSSDQPVILAPLQAAEHNLGWWHQVLGISESSTSQGSGISVGIIDSGIWQSPDSNINDCGSVLNSNYLPELPGIDMHGHGTAVASLLARRPATGDLFLGTAPGASIFSIKAFDFRTDELTTGTSGEIDEAIYHLVKKKVDLINCSFALDEHRGSTQQQIDEAYEQGVLCICAAGNDPKCVGFPARLAKTISVSAIGLGNTIKNGTLIAAELPPRKKPYWQGEYFIANFSGRGAEINCCAPGVGLIAAALPDNRVVNPLRVVSGTSFAAPLVSGVLACALSADPHYLSLPRNTNRSDYAFSKLKEICNPLGFPSEFEGFGLPRSRT